MITFNRRHNRFRMLSERRQQCGFTVVSMLVACLIGGVAIAGGWAAVNSLQSHWHVSQGERLMDQYAASAMQELTNILSWSWGGKQIVRSGSATRWQFYMDDIIEEYGQMQAAFPYPRDLGKMMTLTFQPNRGILYSGVQPKWAANQSGDYYFWTSGRRARMDRGQITIRYGGQPRQIDYYNLDRRDRMTVEGFQVEFVPFNQYGHDLRWQQAVSIKLTLHYSFNAPGGITTLWGGGTVVRERVYETVISMRNWDVEKNDFRDQIIGPEANNGG